MKITLKALRVNANLKQEEVAKILGITKQTLINYEKGYTSPTIEILNKLVELYHVDIGNIDLPKRIKKGE